MCCNLGKKAPKNSQKLAKKLKMNYLESSYYFDFEDDTIQELIAPYQNKSLSDKEKTIGMYLHVRDHWRYDPYSISLSPEKYKASTIAQKTTGNCVEKSIVLIACLRALGIPARLHLGKVKNLSLIHI